MAATCYLLAACCCIWSESESKPLSCECVSWCFRNIVYISSSHTESGGKQEREREKKKANGALLQARIVIS